LLSALYSFLVSRPRVDNLARHDCSILALVAARFCQLRF
jgi:hypothetical protein